MNSLLKAKNTNTKSNALQRLFSSGMVILLFGVLLFIFSVISIISNIASQKKIKQIQEIHLQLPYQMSLLFNEVNLAAAAQNNYFKKGDTTFDAQRTAIWANKIKPIANAITAMKQDLEAADNLAIEKVISALDDYEIAQDEMNLIWKETQTGNPQQRKEAENKLNERRLTLKALTQEDATAILIPLQSKYQQKASLEMQIINKSAYQSNWTILLSAFFTIILILLLLLRQRQLIKAKKDADTASKVKSEFLANMSHEIRTPLNGVIGFTDLLMQSKLTGVQQEYMQTVSQSANSLLDIINDILDFSKIEAGKLELTVDKTDLIEVSGQVADMIKYQAHKKGLEVLLNISNKIPRYIWADEIRLRQILINLLSNAVKFTEFGEIELKIEALENNSLKEQNIFRFSVRDTGIGVHPKNQQKIFDAFSQEDSSTTKRFGGTGLGLAITNKLLELMGSHLQIQSEVGKGSVFYFDVALKSMYGSIMEWENTENIESVLIVDDNTNNRIILREMLALKSITADEAKSGLEALDMLKAKKYDVIIMDYHMPYMDGIETIRKIREMYPTAGDQPVVLLYSSSDDGHINIVCDELQVQQRLVKPLKINQLYTSLSFIKAKNKKLDVQQLDNAVTESKEKLIQYKVVIAEDNAINMLLARTIIKNILPDAKIFEVTNGKQALDIFKEQQPDIIFMDVQMPELNGYDATMAIRNAETGKRVPIIALTAGTVKGEKEKCLEAGMDDYISKPFVKKTMEDIIKVWLKAIV
jgi:signal transduction histidine kinase/CheY-like chemotaxis protein